MEIKSLGQIDFEQIYKAFEQAFTDYEVQLSKVQLKTMLKRRGFDPNLSFAAFDNKNDIIAFTLNGIGTFNGIPTAYDTGTGTLKDYRGKGIATKIFEHSIPYLKEKNIKQYLLEVLQHNTNAVSVYKNLGFEITREFNYFIQKNEEIKIGKKVNEPYCVIKQIEIVDFDSIIDFWDFYPSWQNSFEAIKREIENFVVFGAYINEKLVGYCVFEPISGDIAQISVDKQNRRKGIATLLLQKVIKLNKNEIVKIVNTDIFCNSITDFLQTKNINVNGKQFEMTKKI